MVDLSKLSGPKLQARYDRLLAEGSVICRELIAQGHGNERGSETRARALESGDPLACRWLKNSDEFSAVVGEIEARQRYHGTMKPIRR